MERKCLILSIVFVLQFFVSHLRKHNSILFNPFSKFSYLLADGREMTLKDYYILKREVLTPVDETVQININKYEKAVSYLYCLVSLIKVKDF